LDCEVAEALIRIWGLDRIGVRLSPMGKMNDIHDDQPEATFGYIAERLSDYRFAYLHIVNPALEQMQSGKAPDSQALVMVETIRKRFKGTLMVAGGFQADTAARWLREGEADLIAFGRKFIANPDLPERLRIGAPFNADDPTRRDTRTIRLWHRIAANNPRPVSTSAGGDPPTGKRRSW
jgi:N-ethylmaleimide reductase